jgi:hypothetical protein
MLLSLKMGKRLACLNKLYRLSNFFSLVVYLKTLNLKYINITGLDLTVILFILNLVTLREGLRI